MLYREIIAVCSQIHTKHINILCGQILRIQQNKTLKGLTQLRQHPARQYRSSPDNVTAPLVTANEYTSNTLKRQCCDFTITGHLPVFRHLSANVKKLKGITSVCLRIKSALPDAFLDSSQLDIWRVSGQWVSLVTAGGQVHQSREQYDKYLRGYWRIRHTDKSRERGLSVLRI